jgi:hypothetical protein
MNLLVLKCPRKASSLYDDNTIYCKISTFEISQFKKKQKTKKRNKELAQSTVKYYHQLIFSSVQFLR